MGRSSHVNRFEPNGMYFEVYPEMLFLFRNVGWDLVFSRFNGHNLTWCHDFIYSFDGKTARIKTLKFPFVDESIVGAIGFPTEGENWFIK